MKSLFEPPELLYYSPAFADQPHQVFTAPRSSAAGQAPPEQQGAPWRCGRTCGLGPRRQGRDVGGRGTPRSAPGATLRQHWALGARKGAAHPPGSPALCAATAGGASRIFYSETVGRDGKMRVGKMRTRVSDWQGRSMKPNATRKRWPQFLA